MLVSISCAASSDNVRVLFELASCTERVQASATLHAYQLCCPEPLNFIAGRLMKDRAAI